MDKDRIAGSAKDFAGKADGAVGDMAGDPKPGDPKTGDPKTRAEGRFREATGTAQNLYGQAKDAAREAKDAAFAYAKESYGKNSDTFRDGSQAIAKSVQENPLGSLLIAGGIGFALSLMMTRRPRRSTSRWRSYG